MSKQSIYQKFIDQVRAGTDNPHNERLAIIGSLIIALSGLLLYADKALAFWEIEIWMPTKFAEKGVSPEIFIWLVAQTLSPLLIIIGSILRPYFYAYLIPIYCYVLQFYFVLIDYSLVDDGYSHMYSLGISILLVLMMQWARKASQRKTKMMIDRAKEKIRKARIENAAE
ncbi:MAG: hypothetical protein AAF849_00785 [Bacteroidota bacterium]